MLSFDANIAISSTGLAIKAGSSALAKVGTAFSAWFKEKFYEGIAAGDLPSLTAVGTIANGTKSMVAVYSTTGGTFSLKVLESGIANASNFNQNNWKASENAFSNSVILLGFITISATSADFVGGTTALDAATCSVKYYEAFNMAGLAI